MRISAHRLVITAIMGMILLAGGLLSYFLPRSISLKPVQARSPMHHDRIEIAGYRSWTKVNPQPALMHAASAFACARPTLPVPNPPGVKNPHLDKFITVYVNDVGRKPMLEMKTPAFPKGSIIVKEKLSGLPGSEPELLTVMIKREPGFNPETGDWEYMVTDGTGATVQARGKLENCQACHVSRPKNDYIFRDYLPNDVRSKLK